MKTINVATDFTRYPSGRYVKNGGTSGEGFRLKCLVPAYESGEDVVIELDGTVGYGSSFLEEAFGGLVRQLNVSADAILSRFKIVSKDASIVSEVEQYIRDAAPAAAKK